METWKNVNEFYAVSSEGRGKSLERVVMRSNGRPQHVKEKPLVQHNNGTNHLFFRMTIDGDTKNVPIHRLVAQAFIPNPNGYTVVHHINHDGTDNRVENLVWMTEEEHRVLHAVEQSKRVDQIDAKTGEVLRQWDNAYKAAKELNFDESAICNCCNGKRTTHKGYIWKYALE